jgi:hypothetical protein
MKSSLRMNWNKIRFVDSVQNIKVCCNTSNYIKASSPKRNLTGFQMLLAKFGLFNGEQVMCGTKSYSF